MSESTDKVHYLFLDLNSYFASVEQQEDPKIFGKPVVVVPTMTDKTCAIAASYEAKEKGIKTGTMIYEALKMCPDLIIRPAHHDVYVDYHHAIIDEIERHVPIETVHSIDEVACRLIGRECELRNAFSLARRIKQGIMKNVGPAIRSSVGLSNNAYLAKLATELEKPDGLQVLFPSDLPERILHMNLRNLPWVGHGIERRLGQAGIHDVKKLWSLEPGQMRRIWGSVMGQRFWYMLHGTQVPSIETTKRAVSHSHVLAPDLRPSHLAHLVARRLLAKAAARMRRMDYWTSNVFLKIKFVAGASWKSHVPVLETQDTFTLVRALDGLWKDMQQTFGELHVKQVSIVLGQLKATDDIEADLLDDQKTNKEDLHLQRIFLSKALDTINRRYGRDTITIGVQPNVKANYMGTKIAFTRIPDRQEFHE